MATTIGAGEVQVTEFEAPARTYKTGAATLFNRAPVKLSAEKTVVLAESADDEVVGLVECGYVDGKRGTLDDPYPQGVPITVRLKRPGLYTYVIAGGAVAVGDYVAPTTGGKFVKFDPATDTGNIFGQAESAASDDGDVILVRQLYKSV